MPGTYTLELSANDGIHAVAYDTVILTATHGIRLTIVQKGTNVTLNWLGGAPPYLVQEASTLSAALWGDLLTTNVTSINLPVNNAIRFFRVRGQ